MDLSNLDRATKEELYKTLAKKAFLKKENILDDFSPNKPQDRFLKSDKRIRALFCGNGTGKTVCLAIDLIYAHTNRHPYKNTDNIRHTWVLVPGLDKVSDYWQEIKKWCPPSLLPKPNKLGSANIRRLEWINGSITTFYSFDQDSGKLEGTNIDALYIDECPPRSLYVAAYRGLRNNPDYYVCFAGTPVSEPWLYTEIYLPAISGEDPNIEAISGSIYDNPHISQDYIEDFKSRLSEDEIKVRIYGEFAALQGRIFKEFNSQTHTLPYQEWPEDWPVYMAIDPHTRKKSTAVWIGVTKDEHKVVINECAEEDIEKLAEKIIEIEKEYKYRIVLRRIDNSGSGRDWTGISAVEILNRYGLRVSPMRQKEKAVNDGIIKIKRALKLKECKDGISRPDLFIMENCVNCRTDFEMYGWQEQKQEESRGISEKPKKVYDDYVDPVRYIIMSNPRYNCALDPINYAKI